jgi:hypothetical protein
MVREKNLTVKERKQGKKNKQINAKHTKQAKRKIFLLVFVLFFVSFYFVLF